MSRLGRGLKMRNVVSVVLLSLFLAACSWSDLIGIVSPSKGGIDTEIVVGDKNQTVSTEVGKQEAESISNITDTSPFLLALAMLGWFLPTPQGLFRMWKSRNDKE